RLALRFKVAVRLGLSPSAGQATKKSPATRAKPSAGEIISA
ncbi:MAG: hypothetical protein RLZZ220_1869, partial [Pseudomonadota bacterium]